MSKMYRVWKRKEQERFNKACETVHSILDEMVGQFLRAYYQRPFLKETEKDGDGKIKKYVFLDEMAETTQDPLELRSEILNVLIADRDTTASLLSNVFFMLARHPDIWALVRAEVEETFEGRLPDYTALRKMKGVRNLLNECLRLYPPVSFNMRLATANTTLPRGGGPDGQSPVFVKAGQQVNYHVYALHRLPESFGSDAHLFRPDRWDDPGLRPGWGYIPFNGGPRICLGQQLALNEASYTLVRLMQEFESIRNRDLEPNWREQISLVTKSRNGTKVALMKADKMG